MRSPGRFAALLLIVFAASCTKSIDVTTVPEVPQPLPVIVNAPVTETFENGSKPAFTAATINLATGVWSLNDAILSSAADDKRNGAQSVRIQGNGSISTKFDITNAKMIVVASATYSNNTPGDWQLWVSTNSGDSYFQVGNTVSATQNLKNDTFFVNTTSAVRISIRKVSGLDNSINIDDVIVTNQVVYPPVNYSLDDSHLLLGNPSAATTSVVQANNYLMDKGVYTLSYSRERGIANWVAWHLSASDLGSVGRQDDFREDVSLPLSWYQVSEDSYSSSGFDRGHSCPSGDRTSTYAANSTTFLMTNILPQAPNNNQQTWANLEDYSRSLVRQGNELFIFMGSYGVGGTGSKGRFEKIDNGRVTVPAMIWKVIVVIPHGNNDLARVGNSTRVIAVNTPNINTTNSNWKNYRTNVDAIEEATGYDLLSKLPENIQQVLEAKTDSQ